MLKKFAFGILVISILCSTTALGIEKEQDELWEQATRLAAKNANWIPGDSYTKEINFNTKGKIKNIEEQREKIILNDNGEVESQLISYLKNGKDNTEKRLKSYKKDSKEDIDDTLKMFNQNLNPFNPEIQPLISFLKTNQREVINDHHCLVYTFNQRSLKEGDSPMRGLAWLEEDTGIPIAVKYYLNEELPENIKEFSYDISYRFISLQEWYPEKIVFKFKGKVSIINIDFISETMFDNFWRIKQLD